MAAPRSNESLRELLTPVVAGTGFELDGLAVTPAGRRRLVRVTIDGDTPVDLDTVADISRAISDALDAADVFGASPYVLEVGSPGVERPLTEPRHWRRALGRLVEVTPVPGAGGPLTGRLLGVTETGVVLDLDGSTRELSWAGIDRARVQVEFRRPDEGAGEDGADPVVLDGDDDTEDLVEGDDGDQDDDQDDDDQDDDDQDDDDQNDDDQNDDEPADGDDLTATATRDEGGGTTWTST